MVQNRLQQATAIFLLGLLAWVTLPPGLWHSHDKAEAVETYDCEHNSHLNHEQEDCLICDWQSTQTFLPAKEGARQAQANSEKLTAFCSTSVFIVHFQLPFQRGPPFFIQS
jgi:hypothetical protein